MTTLAQLLSPGIHQHPEVEHVPYADLQRIVEIAFLRLSGVEGLKGREDAAELAQVGGFGRCADCGAIWLLVDLVLLDDAETLACVECKGKPE